MCRVGKPEPVTSGDESGLAGIFSGQGDKLGMSAVCTPERVGEQVSRHGVLRVCRAQGNGVRTGMCLSQLPGDIPGLPPWCQPLGTQLSALQVTLACCWGRGGLRKWDSLRWVLQGFNVSCRSGQAARHEAGGGGGAGRGQGWSLPSRTGSGPVTALWAAWEAVPSKQR